MNVLQGQRIHTIVSLRYLPQPTESSTLFPQFHLSDVFAINRSCFRNLNPPVFIYDTFKFQNGRKDIVKVIHVTPVVLTQFYEATRVFVSKKKKKKTNLPLIYKILICNVHSWECITVHECCVHATEDKTEVKPLESHGLLSQCLYIYIYETLLSKATYSAFRLYIFFYQYVCSLGLEPTTFCAANAMLYHWATGTLFFPTLLELKCVSCVAAYRGVRKFSDFIKNILICVLKMNEGLTGLERHEDE